MPYIIETLYPWADEREPARRARARRAVATLDEAREDALDAVWTQEYSSRDPEPDLDAARALPEAGGTIGPLPDGTVIVVEHVPTMSLSARIPGERCYDWGFSMAEIVDAFNAAQVS